MAKMALGEIWDVFAENSAMTEYHCKTNDWIVASPSVLGGKPCIRGTRISVGFILELLANGASREEILDTYPQVTDMSLSAAIAYAADALKHDVILDVPVTA